MSTYVEDEPFREFLRGAGMILLFDANGLVVCYIPLLTKSTIQIEQGERVQIGHESVNMA